MMYSECVVQTTCFLSLSTRRVSSRTRRSWACGWKPCSISSISSKAAGGKTLERREDGYGRGFARAHVKAGVGGGGVAVGERHPSVGVDFHGAVVLAEDGRHGLSGGRGRVL